MWDVEAFVKDGIPSTMVEVSREDDVIVQLFVATVAMMRPCKMSHACERRGHLMKLYDRHRQYIRLHIKLPLRVHLETKPQLQAFELWVQATVH